VTPVFNAEALEESRIELSRKVSRTQLNVHSGYAAIDHRC
jgi:hypothetical protein